MDHHNLCLGCMENKSAAQICPHCGLPADAGPESALHLPPGTVLQDKYLLGRALGQGGFGITYLAWDKILKIKLAIKEYLPLDIASRASGQTEINVYKKEFAGSFQYGLEKYLEEARTLARFAGHPSIVWVRDFFKANGTAYIVMEYVEGVTLKQYLLNKQVPLPFEQALSIFMPVLDALNEVHAEGILHRDISPDNLLISNRGRVVLIDFGAARQAIGEQSRSLSVIMKPGFSPEEQYHSKGKQGPWTDIYAVAASLYCTITGITPPESLSRLREDTIVAPTKLGARIDPAMEKALLKAMAVREKDRYQSVEEFQEALLGSEKMPGKINTAERKDCPYCGEEISEKAIKCRYCQSMLDEEIGVQSTYDSTEKGLAEKKASWATQKALAYSISKRTVKTAALVLLSGLLIFGAVSLFSGGDEVSGPAVSETEEVAQTAAPAIAGDSDSIYYIDYENGTIPLGDLPIGSRVVDPGWEWEFRTGRGYSREEGDQTKPVTWIVVAHDHYDGLDQHVTLLSEELIGRYVFSAATKNHWGESDLRSWLNSAGFYQAFSESFKSAVLTTNVPNKEWENGSAYSTQGKVFIPSTTELGDTNHNRTYQIGSAYPYFQGAGDAKRVARLGNEILWYWTRSPVSGYGSLVRLVYTTGAFFDSGFAYYVYTGVRPALNLKSGILVSEINP